MLTGLTFVKLEQILIFCFQGKEVVVILSNINSKQNTDFTFNCVDVSYYVWPTSNNYGPSLMMDPDPGSVAVCLYTGHCGQNKFTAGPGP